MTTPKELLNAKYGNWRGAMSIERFTWSDFIDCSNLPPSMVQLKDSMIYSELAAVLGLNWHLGLFNRQNSYLAPSIYSIHNKYKNHDDNHMSPTWMEINFDIGKMKNNTGKWKYAYTIHEDSAVPLKEMLLAKGPLLVSIDVDADYDHFHSYGLKVVPPSSGPQSSRVVLLLGWLGDKYLIQENKGKRWGEGGFAMVDPKTRCIGGKIRLTIDEVELTCM